MELYHQTLNPPSAASHAVAGRFTGQHEHELCVVRGGRYLEVHALCTESGRLSIVCATHVVGHVRSMAVIPATDGDLLAVGSDAGILTILEFTNGAPKARQHITFGRPGLRRFTPGEYVAADTHGRVVMVAAVQKQRLFYLADNSGRFSGPLESHRSSTVTYALAALDTGYSAPVFAALESRIGNAEATEEEAEEGEVAAGAVRRVAFYRVDTALRSVMRKASAPLPLIDGHAIMAAGSNRALVLCRGGACLANLDGGEPTVLRTDTPDELVVSASPIDGKWMLFGDSGAVYLADENSLKRAALQLPFPDTIAKLGSGFFFCGSSVRGSADIVFEAQVSGESLESAIVYEGEANSAACVDARILPSGTILAAVGNSVRLLEHGLQTNVLARSELRGPVHGVWSLADVVILAHADSTAVLRVDASGISEVEDDKSGWCPVSGIRTNMRTLDIAATRAGGYLQVHRKGLVYVQVQRPNGDTPVDPEFKAGDQETGDRQSGQTSNGSEQERVPQTANLDTIDGRSSTKYQRVEIELENAVRASVNATQAAVLLGSGTLVYFEVSTNGSVVERARLEAGTIKGGQTAIRCVALPAIVDETALRAPHIAIGLATDNTLRLLSTDPESLLDSRGMQALAASPCAINMKTSVSGPTVVYSGLENGVVASFNVRGDEFADEALPALFTGTRVPVRVDSCVAVGQSSAFLLRNLAPLVFPGGRIDYAARLASSVVPPGHEGMLAVYRSGSSAYLAAIAVPEHPLGSYHVSNSIELDGLLRRLVSVGKDAAGREYTLALMGPRTGTGPSGFQWIDAEGDASPINITDGVPVCATTVVFDSRPDTHFLAVGLLRGSAGAIALYTVTSSSRFPVLQHVHETALEAPIGALGVLGGRLVAGVGPILRTYDVGRARLLRKAELRLPSAVTAMAAYAGSPRLWVGTLRHSVLALRVLPTDGRLVRVAADCVPRGVMRMAALDTATVAAWDRLGAFFVVRIASAGGGLLPDDDESTLAVLASPASSPPYVERSADFYVGDIAVGLAPADSSASAHLAARHAAPGGVSSMPLLYTTLTGAIGVIHAFTNSSMAREVSALQDALDAQQDLLGRGMLAFRAGHSAAKGVVDGDMLQGARRMGALPGMANEALAALRVADPTIASTPADLESAVASLECTH